MSTSPITPDYSPTSKTPYRAPETPPLPEITAPPAHADMQQPAAPSMVGGKTKGIAVIATLADSILRGAVRGRDYANQVKAQKQQRMAQGLNYNYQTARNNYLGMLKSGADPNSKQVQEAKNAADAAWEIQQQFYQNMFGQDQGKKGKSKKSSSNSSSQSGGDSQGQQQPNPMAMWASGDPVQRLQAAMIIRQKAGPDYQGEAAQYNDAYRKQVAMMKTQQSLEGSQQQLEQGITQDKIDLRAAEMEDTAKMTPEQKNAHDAKVKSLRDRVAEVADKYSQKDKVIRSWVGDDGKEHILKQMPNGEEVEEIHGAVRQPVGMTPRESDTTATDAFGNVTHSQTIRKPITGGQAPGASPSAQSPAPLPTAHGANVPHTDTGTQPQAHPSSRRSGGTASSTRPQLDPEGHIPAGVANANVTEAANQLLDGTDKDKLPMKAREPAAALARKYGWEQGKFTPKEQVMLRESTTFLQEAMNNPAMAALDGSYTDRLQLAQILKPHDDKGVVDTVATTVASSNLNPQQAEFVRMYNQLVGTISGMAQLVRSGRATEATIERLKAELPNPMTTRDSTDGKKRIKRLMKEIDVAMKKGSFEGTSEGGDKDGGKGDASSSSTKSIDDQIMEAIHGSGQPK